jgi:hypothetical protein
MSVTTSPPATADPLAATASPSAFADPLAEDALTPASFTPSGELAVPGEPAGRGSLTRDRAALLAPDLEGHSGAEAIELVRASGLIAAIETVETAEDAQQGLVVEQDPPAGTQMLREGVLTLSIAQAPAESQDTEDEDAEEHQPASGTSAYGQDEDDTEQWFAELRPSARADPAPESVQARTPRRRRKHRQAPIPVTRVKSRPALQDQFSTGLDSSDTLQATAPLEVPSDPLTAPWDSLPDRQEHLALSDAPLEEHPDPSLQQTVRHSLPDWQEPVSPEPAAYDPPAEEGLHQSPQPTEPGLFTYVIAALLVRLPDGSVARTWRRRALIFATAIVGLLLFTRAGALHSHHAMSTSLAQAPASPLRDGASTAVRHPRPTRMTPHDRPAPRLPAVPPRRAEASRTSHDLVAATASAAHPVRTTTAPSSPPSEPPPGPFVYLGK